MKLRFIVLFFLLTLGIMGCSNNENKQPAIKEKKAILTKKKSVIKNSNKKDSTIKNKHTMKIDQNKVSFLMGKFEPKQQKDFVLIDIIHADRKGLYLQAEAYEAFKKMYLAAQKDGIKLVIRSATRNFNYQQTIWEGKWSGKRKVNGKDLSKSIPEPKQRAKEILKYSSMPGSSRHHWGTDIDLNSFDNSWFEKGEGKKIYDWLLLHGERYGYCQVYTTKDAKRPNGYEEEKWHWSFFPLSKKYTREAKQYLDNQFFTQFLGAETALDINILDNYILGISQSCL